MQLDTADSDGSIYTLSGFTGGVVLMLLGPKARLLIEARNPCEMKAQATQLSITYSVMCLGFF